MDNIKQALSQINKPQFISFRVCKIQNMRKKDNPYFERVVAHKQYTALVGFKPGEEDLPWGEYVTTCLIEHKGHTYLMTKSNETVKVAYYLDNKEPIEYEEFEEFLDPPRERSGFRTHDLEDIIWLKANGVITERK